MKILVAEDEKNIAMYIKKGLEELSYVVDIAIDGEEAVYMASINGYDVILLDVMMPKINGFEVAKNLRKQGVNSYIIIITAKDKIEDKVKGLDSGADDYITKPFSFAELSARIRAVMRRGLDDKTNELKVKDLKLNLVTREVVKGEEKIELTAKEFALLEYFLRNKNQVLTRTMIAERVWEIDFLTDTNVIDVYINHLRKKIEKNKNEKIIHTVRGVGYTLKG